MIRIEKNKIRFHYDAEELWIEPWGKMHYEFVQQKKQKCL